MASSPLTLSLLSEDRAVVLATCAGTAKAGLAVGAAHDSDFSTSQMRELAPRQALLLPGPSSGGWGTGGRQAAFGAGGP